MLKPYLPGRLPVVLATAAGLLASACQREAEPSTPRTEPTVPAESQPQPTVRPADLDRRGLLTSVAQAASTYTATGVVAGTEPLVGRQFDIRLAFGCEGAAALPADGAGDGLARWSWGPDRKTIRLSLTPVDLADSALIAGAGQVQWEAVEGFWVPRPWMTADDCPAVRAGSLSGQSATPSPPTVGLAAVFETDGSRIGRRNGRAYTHTLRQVGDAPLVALHAGYRVRLQGRVVAFPDGQAIRCHAAHADQRPVCMAAVQLDRVAFENATGDGLSEWRPG